MNFIKNKKKLKINVKIKVNEQMILNRGYRYKLYPTLKQEILLSNHCFNANQAFNILVSLNRNQFKHNKDKTSIQKQNKSLNLYSQEYLAQQRIYLSSTQEDDIVKMILKNRKLDVNTKVLQQTRMLFNKDLQKKLKNIDKLKSEHFQKEKDKQLKFNLINKYNNSKNKEYKIKKFELFNYKKSGKFGYHSFQTTREQFTLLDYKDQQENVLKQWKILRLFGEEFKIKWSRNLISDIKTITITKEPNGEWYISFSQTIPLTIKPQTNHKEEHILGMDLNIDNVVFSDAKVFSHEIKNKNVIKRNPKLLELKQKQSLYIENAKNNKSNQNKVNNNKGYIKTTLTINKLEKKNNNIKDYELHKFVNELITYMKEKQITLLKMEKLNTKEMTSVEQDTKNSNIIGKYNSKEMRKNIIQVSFSKLQYILSYKCVQFGIAIEYVEATNTTKKCHCCSYINQLLTLKDKQWKCSKCGTFHLRDVNAAINIKNSKGLKQSEI